MTRAFLLSSVLFLLASVFVFLYSTGEATAQLPGPLGVQQLQLSVADGRPVASAILEVERRHGFGISYEDVPVVLASDVKNVAADVRRDLGTFAAKGQTPPPVIVPKGGAINFSYDTDRATGVPINLEKMLGELLQASTDAGNAGTFRVVEGRGMTHVIPVASKDATGIVAAVMPVLDSKITMSVKNGNGIQALLAFCKAVSGASGENVVPGTIPLNLFGHTSITLDENQRVARETLVDILAQIQGRLSWQLFYDPGMRFYALNIHVVP